MGCSEVFMGLNTLRPCSISPLPNGSQAVGRGDSSDYGPFPPSQGPLWMGPETHLPSAPCESCPTRRVMLPPPGGTSLWKGHGGESAEPALYVTRASPSGADRLWWIRQITQVLEPGENFFFFFSIYKRGRRPTVSYPALWTQCHSEHIVYKYYACN